MEKHSLLVRMTGSSQIRISKKPSFHVHDVYIENLYHELNTQSVTQPSSTVTIR